MSTQECNDMPAAEVNLGKVLALINRVLPRLDEPARASDVQAALRKAACYIEAARLAHADGACGPVSRDIVAVIAAAISTVLSGPYKLVSVQAVQKVTVPAPRQSAWAAEGRSAIFMSHQVR